MPRPQRPPRLHHAYYAPVRFLSGSAPEYERSTLTGTLAMLGAVDIHHA